MPDLTTRIIMTIGSGWLLIGQIGFDVPPITGTTLGHVGACVASAALAAQAKQCWRLARVEIKRQPNGQIWPKAAALLGGLAVLMLGYLIFKVSL